MAKTTPKPNYPHTKIVNAILSHETSSSVTPA
ncbi:MAG: hypothetical protein ACI9RP_001790, partial [Cyclobacteriaceae bacterium]